MRYVSKLRDKADELDITNALFRCLLLLIIYINTSMRYNEVYEERLQA
jgi:hypothetical protein